MQISNPKLLVVRSFLGKVHRICWWGIVVVVVGGGMVVVVGGGGWDFCAFFSWSILGKNIFSVSPYILFITFRRAIFSAPPPPPPHPLYKLVDWSLITYSVYDLGQRLRFFNGVVLSSSSTSNLYQFFVHSSSFSTLQTCINSLYNAKIQCRFPIHF